MDNRRYASTLIVAALSVLGMSERDAFAHYEPCKVADGKDSCPKAESCSRNDGTTGICLPPPCDADVDCKISPLLKCDKRQVPPFCIECYSDTDCTAPLTCELDVRNPLSYRCVECGPGHVQSCVGSDAGHACVFEQGVCGCIDTPDCPTGTFCRRGACIPRPTAPGPNSGDDAGRDASPDAAADGGPDTSGTIESGGAGCASTTQSWSALGASSTVLALFGLAFRRRLRRRATRARS